MSDTRGESESYSEAETKARADAALQRMLATPHKPHKPKGIEPKRPKKTSPIKQKL